MWGEEDEEEVKEKLKIKGKRILKMLSLAQSSLASSHATLFDFAAL